MRISTLRVLSSLSVSCGCGDCLDHFNPLCTAAAEAQHLLTKTRHAALSYFMSSLTFLMPKQTWLVSDEESLLKVIKDYSSLNKKGISIDLALHNEKPLIEKKVF